MKSMGNILLRIVATFAASGLSVIGAGAIAGVDTITVAGLTAVAAVVEKLARGFMNDGKLDLDEINAAFAAVDTKAKSAADLQVEAKQNGTDILVMASGGTAVLAAAGKPEGQVPDEQPVDEDWDKEDN
jgi:ABC-type phosphate transport system substrate-binding protein